MLSPIETAKEVAKLLEEGHMCFVERSTRDITPILLEEINSPENKTKISSIEHKISNYIKVEEMPNHTLLFNMQDFLEEVTDQDIKRELATSLKRKKPTRNFLQVVTSRFDINQHWKLFITKRYIAYVEKVFITDYNY